MKHPRADRTDDRHIILRSGNKYTAERAQDGKMVVGYGRTVKEAINDCERRATA